MTIIVCGEKERRFFLHRRRHGTGKLCRVSIQKESVPQEKPNDEREELTTLLKSYLCDPWDVKEAKAKAMAFIISMQRTSPSC